MRRASVPVPCAGSRSRSLCRVPGLGLGPRAVQRSRSRSRFSCCAPGLGLGPRAVRRVSVSVLVLCSPGLGARVSVPVPRAGPRFPDQGRSLCSCSGNMGSNHWATREAPVYLCVIRRLIMTDCPTVGAAKFDSVILQLPKLFFSLHN